MKRILFAAALALTPVSTFAEAHRQPIAPEGQDALVVTCGLAGFIIVAAGVVTGPAAGALVPILPALCYIWDEAGRPPIERADR